MVFALQYIEGPVLYRGIEIRLYRSLIFENCFLVPNLNEDFLYHILCQFNIVQIAIAEQTKCGMVDIKKNFIFFGR